MQNFELEILAYQGIQVGIEPLSIINPCEMSHGNSLNYDNGTGTSI